MASAAYSHIWRASYADYPCNLTGNQGPDPSGNGQIWIEITNETGTTSVPPEQILTLADWKAEQKKAAKAAKGNGAGTAPNALAQTEAVLALVYGPQIGQAWVTTVNDVDDAAQWSGGRYEAFRDQMLATTTTHGHYFNVTSIRKDETHRTDATSEFGLCTFFDDVGDTDANPYAKMSQAWLDLLGPEPSFVNETSEGNHQYFYVFDEPVEMQTFRALNKAFRSNPDTRGGFEDGTDSVRYGRLPSGINTRPEKGGFATRLVSKSGKRYSVAKLVRAFNLMLKPERERVEPKDMGTRVLNVAPEMRLPLIKQAATAIVNDLDRTERIHFAHALDGALDGDPEAEDIFLEFSSRRTEGRVDEAKDQRTWDTRGKGRAGYGFIMQLLEKQGTEEAKAAHAAIRQAQAAFMFDRIDDDDDDTPPSKLPKLIPHRFVEGKVRPPREWLVKDGWIPMKKVALLQGDGGDGKTLLIHQLQASCATGLPWIGLPVEECVSVGFYTEDDGEDVEERQDAIDAYYGRFCIGAGKMHIFPRDGKENELVVFDRDRKAFLTPFYHQIVETVMDLKARALMLDVAVDMYGGNEIVRTEVRAMFRALRFLARKMNGAVVMSMHVSQSGIRSEGGHSGSTDWSNAARARLYLNRPKGDDGEYIDPNLRVLTRKKANHAPLGDTVHLRWQRGLLVRDGIAEPDLNRPPAEDVFLTILDAVIGEGQIVSPKPRAGNFAPLMFMRRPLLDRHGYQRADFERALQRLLQRGVIKITSYGPPSDKTQTIIRNDAPEEEIL